jgi:hypothetical protein
MLAIKGEFDGKRVVLTETPHVPRCPVIVVFGEEAGDTAPEPGDWLRVQEAALAKVWENEEDAVYDRL